MNRWLGVVVLVMLVLASAVGLRNAVAHTGNGNLPVMMAKDGGRPIPPDTSLMAKDGGRPIPPDTSR